VARRGAGHHKRRATRAASLQSRPKGCLSRSLEGVAAA